MNDFVIPLHKRNFIIRTVIEGIIFFYHPNNIYIIVTKIYIHEMEDDIKKWEKQDTIIHLIEEETFFIENYNLNIDDIKKLYYYIDEKSREFGWWYQQIIKLGAVHQIKNLSDPFIVWDSDLIPILKWSLEYPYKFAILQEKAKNIFNNIEYEKSIYEILKLNVIEPEKGTFVPHHFIIHHNVIKNMLKYIMIDKIENSWIELIMKLSSKYYRFSEYKCLATYMNSFYPKLLLYHSFDSYGKSGIRYRENEEIIKIIKELCIIDKCGLKYSEIIKFVNLYYEEIPSYLQIEHI
jgi:hypothetical protein